jgi:hypothetical protein
VEIREKLKFSNNGERNMLPNAVKSKCGLKTGLQVADKNGL